MIQNRGRRIALCAVRLLFECSESAQIYKHKYNHLYSDILQKNQFSCQSQCPRAGVGFLRESWVIGCWSIGRCWPYFCYYLIVSSSYGWSASLQFSTTADPWQRRTQVSVFIKTDVRVHWCCLHYSAGHSFSLKCGSGDFLVNPATHKSSWVACPLHLEVISAYLCIENASGYFRVMVLTVQTQLSLFSIFRGSRNEEYRELQIFWKRGI